MAMVSGIQGQLLDVTVVKCSKLKDTEWISRQDPYVCLEYASTKFRTRTCTDGGKNPVFQEKINVPLIEGLREITVTVWNSNTITFDGFIGTGRIQLQKVLSQGYDDSSWPLQSKSGKFAGEVTVIMHFANAKKGDKSLAGHAPTQPTHMPTAPPLPVASYAPPPPPPSYAPPAYPSSVPPGPPAGYPPPYGAYPSQPPPPYPAGYPPVSYPATSYAPPPMPQAYPPQAYPPPAYPPQPYPPPPPAQPYYPPGSYPGAYPPY